MNSITQNMKYRQSLIHYAERYGVSRASRKYNRARSYIYFWKARYGGTLASLPCQSTQIMLWKAEAACRAVKIVIK